MFSWSWFVWSSFLQRLIIIIFHYMSRIKYWSKNTPLIIALKLSSYDALQSVWVYVFKTNKNLYPKSSDHISQIVSIFCVYLKLDKSDINFNLQSVV